MLADPSSIFLKGRSQAFKVKSIFFQKLLSSQQRHLSTGFLQPARPWLYWASPVLVGMAGLSLFFQGPSAVFWPAGDGSFREHPGH